MDRVDRQGAELIASITYRIFQYANRKVAAVVFNELETGIPWDVGEDPQGYNFCLALLAGRRPAVSVWHRVEI